MATRADEEEARIALSMLKGVNADTVRRMEDCGISPQDFFSLSVAELSEALDVRGDRWQEMDREAALFRAREELEKMRRYSRMGSMFFSDSEYPEPLRNASDAPVVIHRLGDISFDTLHCVSVVGTRRATPYGLDFARRIVEELGEYFPDLIVISGLALGIDTAAHTAALGKGLRTVAVVAHGLHMIYPASNRGLAREIVEHGGAIVTEYRLGEKPWAQRFLERNRIIAGLSTATIVVESDIRGGAMSTAYTADSYHREVMALPGRVGDKSSAGCNHLIRKGRAQLITCAADLIEQCGWQPMGLRVDALQRNLFPELEGDGRLIYDTLRSSGDPLTVDDLCMRTRLTAAKMISTLTELEFDGVVARHSGGRYSVVR